MFNERNQPVNLRPQQHAERRKIPTRNTARAPGVPGIARRACITPASGGAISASPGTNFINTGRGPQLSKRCWFR